MFISITSSKPPAANLGYILHKNPDAVQEFAVSWGKVHVFYPESSEERCTAVILADVDPVALVRGRTGSMESGPLEHYINDRPYVASSFMSVAIARIFSSALRGVCNKNPELPGQPLPLEVKIAVVYARGGEQVIRKLFEPLGYKVDVVRHTLDEKFPEWGESSYYTLDLQCEKTVSELLTHLYVLLPVLDDEKHYWVGDDEVSKLMHRGEGWLSSHPEKKLIVERYLKHRHYLAREAFARLGDDESKENENQEGYKSPEDAIESRIPLKDLRYAGITEVLKAAGCRKIIETGCGEGRMLMVLAKDPFFTEIAGSDVSAKILEKAADKLDPERFSKARNGRVKLFQASLSYRDDRFRGYDALILPEVIEHLDPYAFSAFETNIFGYIKPAVVVVSTPNIEYNSLFESIPAGSLRHKDHRFEWTRAQFREWAEKTAAAYGYTVEFSGIGEEDPDLGAPTQMCVFYEVKK
ncbi:MAG: 3' terminal RNA ribose 2'-O-methyltransferase Hen1 [Firmicutes bacterium]|nr:3' terminal RNA ribose 2'-O-methyltransferase Hen1 [Bacillota bacterium]